MLCLLCEKNLKAPTCITDCSHEFCLSCACREISKLKNRCPACHHQIKKIHELFNENNAHEPVPATIRFCNATYIINVSIWSVEDPAKVLATMFQLKHARLIHQGKLLHNGDIWPGTVVQLFGTRIDEEVHSSGFITSLATIPSQVRQLPTGRVFRILLCPCSFVYDFFMSLFGYGVLPNPQERRGYVRVPSTNSNTRPSFQAPGSVNDPPSTDLI